MPPLETTSDPQTPKAETKARPAAAPAPTPATTKLPVVDVNAKLKAIAEKNAASRAELEAYFGPERWAAMMKQAKQRNLTPENITTLCGNMRRSRSEWEMVKGNEQAALILAANHFLIAIGSAPSKVDEEALEKALKAPAAA